jgi:hypothetical protein
MLLLVEQEPCRTKASITWPDLTLSGLAGLLVAAERKGCQLLLSVAVPHSSAAATLRLGLTCDCRNVTCN